MLWIPSRNEVGGGIPQGENIWNLTAGQRNTFTTNGNSVHAYLRNITADRGDGYYSTAHVCFVGGMSSADPTSMVFGDALNFSVRPALHISRASLQHAVDNPTNNGDSNDNKNINSPNEANTWLVVFGIMGGVFVLLLLVQIPSVFSNSFKGGKDEKNM
jgi:hypothetical protein